MLIKIDGFETILVESLTVFTPAAIAQVMDITTVADVSGSLNEKLFYLFSANNTNLYAFQMNMYREVTSVTTIADSGGSLNSTYFLMTDATGAGHYFWFNVSAGGSDPAPSVPSGYPNGHVVALTTNDADIVVASALNTVIDGVTGFSSRVSTNIVVITNAADGVATDAVDGVGTPNQPSGFSFVVDNQGLNQSPALQAETATVIQVGFAINDTANDIASRLNKQINAQADFGSTVTTNIVTVTNAVVGRSTFPTSLQKDNPKFTYDITTAGKGTYTSPPVLYKVVGKVKALDRTNSGPTRERRLLWVNFSKIIPDHSIHYLEE